MFSTYTEDIWRRFQQQARVGIAAGRRRALPADDPRHLPADDDEETEPE